MKAEAGAASGRQGPPKWSRAQGSSPWRRQQSGRPEPSASQVGEKLGGPGACGCQERGWCVRAVVLAVRDLPTCPSLQAAAAGCSLSSVLGSQAGTCFLLPSAVPHPSPHAFWGCGSGERMLARPPRPALSNSGSSLRKASADKAASQPARAALALSLVLPAVPARARALSVLSMVLLLLPEMSTLRGASLPVNLP